MRCNDQVAAAVVVPVFNRLHLLRQTVESLRNQSILSARFFLVDDGSGSEVLGYLARIAAADERFVVLQKPPDLPRGCQTSKNLAMQECRADTVTFLDSDDLLSPDCLEERVAFLRAHPNVDIAVGRQIVFDEVSSQTTWLNIQSQEEPDLDRFLRLCNPLDVPWVNGGCTLRLERLRTLGIRCHPEFRWEDVAFHFDCLVSGMTAQWVPRQSADYFYRLHGVTMGHDLHVASGVDNTAEMLLWMQASLKSRGMWTPGRRQALSRAHFHACVLRALDMGSHEFAVELLCRAATCALYNHAESRRLNRYAQGRRLLHKRRHLTYYWNRFSQRFPLHRFLAMESSNYGVVKVTDSPSLSLLHRLRRDGLDAVSSNIDSRKS